MQDQSRIKEKNVNQKKLENAQQQTNAEQQLTQVGNRNFQSDTERQSPLQKEIKSLKAKTGGEGLNGMPAGYANMNISSEYQDEIQSFEHKEDSYYARRAEITETEQTFRDKVFKSEGSKSMENIKECFTICTNFREKPVLDSQKMRENYLNRTKTGDSLSVYTELAEHLKEMAAVYASLISAVVESCQEYIDKHNPWTSKGKERLKLVKDLKESMEQDRRLFEKEINDIASNVEGRKEEFARIISGEAWTSVLSISHSANELFPDVEQAQSAVKQEEQGLKQEEEKQQEEKQQIEEAHIEEQKEQEEEQQIEDHKEQEAEEQKQKEEEEQQTEEVHIEEQKEHKEEQSSIVQDSITDTIADESLVKDEVEERWLRAENELKETKKDKEKELEDLLNKQKDRQNEEIKKLKSRHEDELKELETNWENEANDLKNNLEEKAEEQRKEDEKNLQQEKEEEEQRIKEKMESEDWKPRNEEDWEKAEKEFSWFKNDDYIRKLKYATDVLSGEIEESLHKNLESYVRLSYGDRALLDDRDDYNESRYETIESYIYNEGECMKDLWRASKIASPHVAKWLKRCVELMPDAFEKQKPETSEYDADELYEVKSRLENEEKTLRQEEEEQLKTATNELKLKQEKEKIVINERMEKELAELMSSHANELEKLSEDLKMMHANELETLKLKQEEADPDLKRRREEKAAEEKAENQLKEISTIKSYYGFVYKFEELYQDKYKGLISDFTKLLSDNINVGDDEDMTGYELTKHIQKAHESFFDGNAIPEDRVENTLLQKYLEMALRMGSKLELLSENDRSRGEREIKLRSKLLRTQEDISLVENIIQEEYDLAEEICNTNKAYEMELYKEYGKSFNEYIKSMLNTIKKGSEDAKKKNKTKLADLEKREQNLIAKKNEYTKEWVYKDSLRSIRKKKEYAEEYYNKRINAFKNIQDGLIAVQGKYAEYYNPAKNLVSNYRTPKASDEYKKLETVSQKQDYILNILLSDDYINVKVKSIEDVRSKTRMLNEEISNLEKEFRKYFYIPKNSVTKPASDKKEEVYSIYDREFDRLNEELAEAAEKYLITYDEYDVYYLMTSGLDADSYAKELRENA